MTVTFEDQLYRICVSTAPEVTTQIFFLFSHTKIFKSPLVFQQHNKDLLVLSFISFLKCCQRTTRENRPVTCCNTFWRFNFITNVAEHEHYEHFSSDISCNISKYSTFLFSFIIYLKLMGKFNIILCKVPRKLDCVINQWWFDRCWKLFLLYPARLC